MTMYDQPNDIYAAILAKLSALESDVASLRDEVSELRAQVFDADCEGGGGFTD